MSEYRINCACELVTSALFQTIAISLSFKIIFRMLKDTPYVILT